MFQRRAATLATRARSLVARSLVECARSSGAEGASAAARLRIPREVTARWVSTVSSARAGVTRGFAPPLASRTSEGRVFDAQTRARSTKATKERTLSEALLAELKHENEAYERSAVVTAGPPKPFALQETDGDAEVTLSRTYGEDEEVHVTFIAQEEPYDDDYDDFEEDFEDDSEDASEEDDDDVVDEEDFTDEIAIDFNVVVNSVDGNSQLEFDCVTDGEIIEIKNVSFESYDENSPMLGTPYTGPNFEDLEESVQDKFHEYLEERGINAELANYIVEAHLDKEQREYTNWLEKVAMFVQQKK